MTGTVFDIGYQRYAGEREGRARETHGSLPSGGVKGGACYRAGTRLPKGNIRVT